MRYCFSLTQDDVEQIADLSAKDFVGFEIRLDSFAEPPDFHVLRSKTEKPLLATWRSRPHLGKASTQSREEEGWAYRKAALASGFDLIDLELDEDRLQDKIAFIQEAGGRVVLSHHELSDNAGIERALSSALETKADVIKIIGNGKQVSDFARQRSFYQMARGRELVHFYMGAEYAATRVLSLVYGGSFTFLTPHAGKAVAPGQLTHEAMAEIYRPLEVVNPKFFAVIGNPVGHSKSPAYHNPKLKQITPDSLFLALPARDAQDLHMLCQTFPELVGLAVTKPMKEVAFRAATDFADPHSADLGAVNTLLFKPTETWAANTDLLAMIDMLKESGPNVRVRVLGYGGLGKAVVRACVPLDLAVQVCNRTPGKVGDPGGRVEELEWEARHEPGADVLIQATSVGMAPNVELSPLDRIPQGVTRLLETIYSPLETRLMRMAREQGLAVVDGLAFFDAQAKIQNRFFCKAVSP